MALAPLVVGVADHNGWAALVCVSVKDGSPEVIDRRRVELIEPGLPKHPYEHETVGMNAARRGEIGTGSPGLGRALRRAGVVAITVRPGNDGGDPLDRVEDRPTAPASRFSGGKEVHVSWPVTVRADAMLYHDALCTSAASRGINVDTFARGEERPRAAEATATTAQCLDRFLSGLRASLGPPWRQDHQAAAARAIAALGRYTTLQLDKPRYP